jgi:hypothetical protein
MDARDGYSDILAHACPRGPVELGSPVGQGMRIHGRFQPESRPDMTKLLAAALLLLLAFQAIPARAAAAANPTSTYEILGVPLTQKRIAIGTAIAAGIGIAALAAVVAESFAIGTSSGFLGIFALFEFLTLPIEAGIAAYLWPKEAQTPGAPTPIGEAPTE